MTAFKLASTRSSNHRAMPEKSALITGITGPDGGYLTELLLGKGYTVHGMIRPTANLHGSRVETPRA